MMTATPLEQGIRLGELLEGLVETGNDATLIKGLCLDSRRVTAGDLFCARRGSSVNAAEFIPQAVKAGAVAILLEGEQDDLAHIGAPVFTTNDFGKVLGEIASRFFGRPSEQVPVIGITGTNGKTSVAWLLTHVHNDSQQPAAMIGTLGIGFADNIKESVNTTPDAITVHGSMATLIAQGARRVVMEVSSHALEQQRVAGVRFDQTLFTNLSREHLDYHSSMETYALAKQRLFTDYASRHRIINIDDEFGRQLWRSLGNDDSTFGYSLKEPVGGDKRIISARIDDNTLDGLTISMHTPWGERRLKSHLLGEFNAYNLLACTISLCLSGYTLAEAEERLARCPAVPGRMERFGRSDTPLVIVDYAHSPDALQNVLQTLKPHTKGRLICVFGCGGDRDKGKRVEMGRVADQHADIIVVTNDNPRNEDPEAILDEIVRGIEQCKHITVEPDRSVAITSAIRQAGPDDTVLIAGKGHESSQLIKGEYLPFSDRNLVRTCLEVW